MSALAAVAVLVLAWWAHRSLAAPRVAALSDGDPRCRSARHRPPTAAEWAGLLDRMAAEVRIGASLSTALAQALAAGAVQGRLVQGRLVHPGVTLAALADPSAVDAVSVTDDEILAAHAIGTAFGLGGPVAATLDTAAAQLRERVALRAEAQAHSAQARLSARVLTAVPVAFCLWNVATSRTVRLAWLGPAGAVCAVAGGLLNLAGWWWMRRIVARALP